jgi:hypothetical protein
VLIPGLLGGCGAAGGPSSPQDAVTRFLAPWSQPAPTRESPKEEIGRYWASACNVVDPDIRRGLRLDDESGGSRVECGGVVLLLTGYTGDTGEMAQPSKITGTPVSAETRGDTSIVTVDLRYESSYRLLPAPPREATAKVLVVRRDGRWWVATPQAFNPLHTRDGGFSERELRAQHEELLAAAAR